MCNPDGNDLFFEILRRKTHIFCDVKSNSNVLELKKIIEGILKIPVNKQVLKKQTDGVWQMLDEQSKLADCGFSSLNARAQEPACLGLVLLGEDVDVTIEPLSNPPPIPDAMRNDHQTHACEQ